MCDEKRSLWQCPRIIFLLAYVNFSNERTTKIVQRTNKLKNIFMHDTGAEAETDQDLADIVAASWDDEWDDTA